MLAIPLATLSMVMSISFLTVLNVSYNVAWPVLVALTIDTLIVLMLTFYNSCVMGVEAFDAEGKISIRKLVRSKIFKVFALPYIQAAIALTLTYLVLTRMPVADPVQATVDVVVILIGAHLSTFIGLYFFMRHSIKIQVAWKSIGKYVLAALLMGALLFLLPTTSTLLSTVAKAVGGFALYIGILLLIDNQARELVKLIWIEIKDTVKVLTSKNNNLQDENISLESEN